MSITVLDSAGNPQAVETLPAKGSAARAGSLPVALATEDVTALAKATKQDDIVAAMVKMQSATKFTPIIVSDTTDLTPLAFRGLFIGVAGNLVVKGSDGVVATFAVAANTVLPISPTRVMAATTAGGIIGLGA